MLSEKKSTRPSRRKSSATASLRSDRAEAKQTDGVWRHKVFRNGDSEGLLLIKIRKRLPAGWGLTQNDRASFVGWSPQPSAVGPVPHQPGFFIVL